MMESINSTAISGTGNLEYFTLEDEDDQDDSEIEEFVAENSTTKRKEFWFGLIESSLSFNSKSELILQSYCSIVSLALEIKLIYYYAANTNSGRNLGWTLFSLIGTGILNLIFAYYWWTTTNKNNEQNQHHENIVSNLKERRGMTLQFSRIFFWSKIFCKGLGIFLMAQPLYNLIAYWQKSSRTKRELKRPLILRSQPEPTKHEIYNVQKSIEFQLSQETISIVEIFLRFLALGLVQCLLIGTKSQSENLQISDDSYIRTFTIAWNLILLSWETVRFSTLHFYYAKSLQFQDVKNYGTSMSFGNCFSTMSSSYSFIMNFVSAGFRLYLLTMLSTFLGSWITIIFIVIIYILLDFFVQKIPNRSRLRFENPIGKNAGLSSRALDLISRGINLFTSHNLKFSAFLNFAYIFTLCYFIPRGFWYLAKWNRIEFEFETDNGISTSSNFFNSSFHNDRIEIENSTVQLTRLEFAQQCNENVTTLLQVPILHSITEFAFELITAVTFNCSIWRNTLFIDDFSVLILLAFHYSISLIICAKISKKIQQSESEFPNQIAYKWWSIWIDKKFNNWKTMLNVPKTLHLEIRKFLIALQLTDYELKNLCWNDRNYCFCCTKLRGKAQPEAGIGGIKICGNSELENLWNSYLHRAKSQILSPKFDRLVQLFERRLTLRNTQVFDSSFNKLIEFLIRNLDEIGLNNLDGLTMLIYSIENIDSLIITKVSSYKLNKLDKILM